MTSPEAHPAVRRWSRWMAALLFRPVASASLVIFRIVLGGLLSVSAVRFLWNGWIARFFVEPTFFFHYWGFSWVRAWNETGMNLHFVALAVLGVCVAAGVFYRITAPLAFLAFTYVELIDVSGYLNHYYLLSLLLLLASVMPLHEVAGFDAWRTGDGWGRRELPRWCVLLVRFQLAIVYFYAGVAKIGGDWLAHGQPLSIWLSSRADLPVLGPLFAHHETALAMSWAGCAYDLTIWIWLSWRRTRPFAYVVVIGFHGMVGWLFNIGMFPFIMTLSALVFFPPEWPQRFGWPSLKQRRVADLAWSRRRWAGTALAVTFLALQALMPLRHHLYGGNVLWHEQGMRWSWKVLIREKNGAVTYRVKRPDGRTVTVSPRRYLLDFQEREMSGQPDLILQLARRIADDERALWGSPISVYVDAYASLNGRPASRLIDPKVDLASIDDDLAAASWILPAPTTSPPHLRPVRAK